MMTFNEIVNSADVIINGYAIQKVDKGFRLVNIHKPSHVAVFSESGKLLETSMDDIELHIAKGYLSRGMSYMEDDDAEVL